MITLTKLMKKLLILLLSLLFFSNLAHSENYLFQGEKSFDVSMLYNSEFNLPTEGERVNFSVSVNPLNPINQTNYPFFFGYVFVKPDGQFGTLGIASFNKGNISGEKYRTNIDTVFDTPGIWKVYYVVITEKKLISTTIAFISSSTTQDLQNISGVQSKDIHVLSFYEASSIRSSNNSVIISVIGVVGTFLAFLLGLFANFVIDKHNNSPKIKVIRSPGFVDLGDGSIPILSVEAINYGRVSVTLSGVGISMKEPKGNLWFTRGAVTPIQFPFELLPGKRYSVLLIAKELQNDLNGKVPDKIFFKDETGRTYWGKSIKNLIK